MKKALKIILSVIVVGFAGIGLTFTGVYFAMQYGLLNVRGSIIERNEFFGAIPTLTKTASTTNEQSEPVGNGCLPELDQNKPCEWNQTIQWQVVSGGLKKDAGVINRVARETGVSPRMIAAAVVPEQTRFFTDNRDVFKRYFEPLKILASMSKFSLGVSGIKQDTAVLIEKYAISSSSDFYPGDDTSSLLVYSSEGNHDDELFSRLTDEKNHYYSYLYTAMFLKEIESQWAVASFDVAKRPDVLVTLFNLGFQASAPKANPQVGGATITVGGAKYSFGYLGSLFYNSDELLKEFPAEAPSLVSNKIILETTPGSATTTNQTSTTSTSN